MSRSLRGLMVTGLLTAALAAPAAAQARGYVGLGGGISIPTGDFADAVKTGWFGQFLAGITGPNGMLGGRIDGRFMKHSYDVADASTRLLGANADIVLSPGMAASKLRPYFLGGLGVFNVNNKIAGSYGDGQTKFAFNLGAGVNVKTGARMSVFAEARYLSIRTDNSIGLIPIAVGFRWGGN